MNKAVVITQSSLSFDTCFHFSWALMNGISVFTQKHRELSCLLPSCEETVRAEICRPGTCPPQNLTVLVSWHGNFDLQNVRKVFLLLMPLFFLYNKKHELTDMQIVSWLFFLFATSHYHEVIVALAKFGLVIQFISICNLCADNSILLIINLYR